MTSAETVHYTVIPSRNLASRQIRDILRLRGESLQSDYPDRSREEIAYFVQNSARAIKNPNRAVGGPTIRKNQSYARSRSVAACQDGKLIAHFTAADNASYTSPEQPSRYDPVLSVAVRVGKLRFTNGDYRGKPLIQSRWHWTGLLALSNDARLILQDTPEDTASFLDVMWLGAAIDRHPEQPVATYPYDQQVSEKQFLLRAGYIPQEGSHTLIEAFGPEAKVDRVGQERWALPSVRILREHLESKKDAAAGLIKLRANNL